MDSFHFSYSKYPRLVTGEIGQKCCQIGSLPSRSFRSAPGRKQTSSLFHILLGAWPHPWGKAPCSALWPPQYFPMELLSLRRSPQQSSLFCRALLPIYLTCPYLSHTKATFSFPPCLPQHPALTQRQLMDAGECAPVLQAKEMWSLL